VASTAFALFSFYDPIQASALERAKDLVGLPAQWQFNFQHPFSQTERELYRFHNFLLGIDVAICALVTTLVVIAICLFRKSRNPVPTSTTHNTTLEVTWTILPVIVLMVIGAWSFPLLKRVDSTPKSKRKNRSRCRVAGFDLVASAALVNVGAKLFNRAWHVASKKQVLAYDRRRSNPITCGVRADRHKSTPRIVWGSSKRMKLKKFPTPQVLGFANRVPDQVRTR